MTGIFLNVSTLKILTISSFALQIDYWLVPDNSTKRQINTNSIITQYTINNLRSFSQYNILVKAFNGFEGPASSTVQATTSQSGNEE